MVLDMNPNEKDHLIEMQSPRLEGRYYRGRIAKYNPKTGYGFVETPKGTQIFFYADQVRLEGTSKKRSDIRPGVLVGYDVAWTDRGVRISKMKLLGKAEHPKAHDNRE